MYRCQMVAFLMAAIIALYGCTNVPDRELQQQIDNSLSALELLSTRKPNTDPDPLYFTACAATLRELRVKPPTRTSPPQLTFAALYHAKEPLGLGVAVFWMESEPTVESIELHAGGQVLQLDISKTYKDNNIENRGYCVYFYSLNWVKDSADLGNFVKSLPDIGMIQVKVESKVHGESQALPLHPQILPQH